MIKQPLFFDTDCLSAFLWVKKEHLLSELYQGKIIIPKPVYIEINHPNTQHLKTRVDSLIANQSANIQEINVDSKEYKIYYQLTQEPIQGHAMIGKGEAATIALAKCYHGTVASNNLRDISVYIKEFSLQHITTGDILMDALQHNIITETQGNIIWSDMLAKRRRLGASTFTDYINTHR